MKRPEAAQPQPNKSEEQAPTDRNNPTDTKSVGLFLSVGDQNYSFLKARSMMIPPAALQQIQNILANGKNFILTSHVNPDGDGIGSEIALAEYLRQIGKEVRILNHSITPDNYEFLDPCGEIELYAQERHADLVRASSAIFILDISDWKRLRDLGTLIQTLAIPKICIDHHPCEGPFVDLDVIYPLASSTGEMLYELLTQLGARIEGRLAQALYTAVMTDTGGFRFSNTTIGAFRVASALVAGGVKPHQVYQHVYENQPPQRMKLLAHILNNLNYEKNGRLAWSVVTQENLRNTNTGVLDTEGFADFPRTIAGVELSLMFLETKEGKVKISFRSKGRYVINGLANRFGGGGHPYAAGALVEGKVQKVISQVIAAAKELLD
jgi:phosphoesterase RecJ-like protein